MLCLSGFELYSRWVPLKTLLIYYQTPEERQTVQNQICHATLLLFFFYYFNKILFIRKNVSLFEQITMSTIITIM